MRQPEERKGATDMSAMITAAAVVHGMGRKRRGRVTVRQEQDGRFVGYVVNGWGEVIHQGEPQYSMGDAQIESENWIAGR